MEKNKDSIFLNALKEKITLKSFPDKLNRFYVKESKFSLIVNNKSKSRKDFKKKRLKLEKMKENAKRGEPDPSEIRKRFFEKREDASKFAQCMQEDGHRTRIRTDGI